MKSETEQELEDLILFDVSKHITDFQGTYLYRNQEILLKAIKLLAKIIKENNTIHYE